MEPLPFSNRRGPIKAPRRRFVREGIAVAESLERIRRTDLDVLGVRTAAGFGAWIRLLSTRGAGGRTRR